MKMVHVTVHTGKLSESVDFYEKTAGLGIQRDMRGKGPVDIVFMGGAAGETCVELISDGETSFHGDGISIGFSVDDAAGCRERLVSMGYTATPVISPAPGVKFFFVNDPDGLRVQFIEG